MTPEKKITATTNTTPATMTHPGRGLTRADLAARIVFAA